MLIFAKMYTIIQESNLLLSLPFLTELKLFPGLKLEFLEAFFNSLQGYYYFRALKKKLRGNSISTGNSFHSVKNSRESIKVSFLSNAFILSPKKDSITILVKISIYRCWICTHFSTKRGFKKKAGSGASIFLLRCDCLSLQPF